LSELTNLCAQGQRADACTVNSVYLDWLLSLLSMGSPKHLMTLLHYMQGQRAEACFVNSVYLDNSSLELYHGLLDKKPGATTMRIRCAGKRHHVSR